MCRKKGLIQLQEPFIIETHKNLIKYAIISEISALTFIFDNKLGKCNINKHIYVDM